MKIFFAAHRKRTSGNNKFVVPRFASWSAVASLRDTAFGTLLQAGFVIDRGSKV